MNGSYHQGYDTTPSHKIIIKISHLIRKQTQFLSKDHSLEHMTNAAQESAIDAPWDEDAICIVSKEGR